MQPNAALAGDNETTTSDLGPLAWVLDELRKSLDGATKALRRFVRDAELARGSDLAALDASQLRIARQQLHQAVGALEMVGMAPSAKVVRAMESLAQKFVQRPESCSDEAANKVERASFALVEYLEGVLKGKTASPVALFPQYRDVLELVGEDRVHPADLWPADFRWIDVKLPEESPPLAYDSAVRARIDGFVLKVVKSADRVSAKAMRDISLAFAAGQASLEPRAFWKISAAYFEAVALGLCPTDVYGKRAASRILLQYRTLARGEQGISERLVQDLLFFCAQAISESVASAPVLTAIRAAYGLTQEKPFDYETPHFGRFDPALLVQARKRIAAATETWSALAGGDSNKLKLATEQFSQLTDTVFKLHPESGELVRALTGAIDKTARSGDAPPPALAMEVATTVLFLEAAYEDLDPTNSHMVERSASLAKRLEHVTAGGQTEPLEGWMEELYRRVSDRQIMGSVVEELRTALGAVEKSLDTYFRNPTDKVPLHEVPSKLAQMRGVFSVLGLDQAAIAALRMRGSVERFLVDDVDLESARTGIFEKLGNSLGALGFLIDMLSYQRTLAKKLFVYDEELGEFKPLMGREKPPAVEAEMPVVPQAPELGNAPVVQVPAPVMPALELPATEEAPAEMLIAPVAEPEAAPVAVTALPVVTAANDQQDDDDTELKDIFLEEAREVIQAGTAAIQDLAADAADLSQQTTLRRAFHTLKGSARMVGLNEFGEAAWSMEQLLNAWLAEQKPASADLIKLADKSMTGFGRWVQDIAAGDDADWDAQAFRRAADGLRLDGRAVELVLPGSAIEVPVPVEEVASEDASSEKEEAAHPDFAATQTFDFEATQFNLPTAMAAEEAVPDLMDFDLDFGQLADSGALEASQAMSPEVKGELQAEVIPSEADEVDSELSVDAQRVPEPEEIIASLKAEPEPEPVELDAEDQIKVIGDLRIDIPLYNVYLNEADEWSRRLLTELSEWSMELDQPIGDSTVGLAHSLAGSSGTVGFLALSRIARALEQALEHVQLHARGMPDHAKVFVEAAEDIRRLLHQFAAGFLKEPSEALVGALYAIQEAEFPAVEVVPEDAAVTQPGAIETTGTDVAQADEVGSQQEESVVRDVLDVDLFPIFEEEALELLPHLGSALRQWVSRPENMGARNEVLRVLHTLKGSARLAGAMHLGEMTHTLESDILSLGRDDLQTSQLEPLLSRFDVLQSTFDTLRATPEEALSLPEGGTSEESTSLPLAAATGVDAAPASAVDISAITPLVPLRAVSGHTVRVRSQLLDRLVNQAGEVMITRSRMEARLGQLRGSLNELTGNLDRLRNQLRDIELQSESQMQTRLAQAKDTAQAFDPLEFDRFTRVQELTRMMAESVHDVATVQRNLKRTVEGTEDDLIAQARQARELQRDLLRTRMVEFEGIAERLYTVVRQAAKDAGKQVALHINGGSLDMDRGVLDRMVPVFEHVLRNSVAHGIEAPADRVKAGKPESGSITIELHQQSNDVVVSFSDDGAGLNLDRIREKAIANGQIAAGQTLTKAELANLIFASGLSTATKVTELAGRGVGLDVVRSEVNALGGRIETSTESGQGTQFKLVLPLTTAVTHVVMLRMGERVIGVPVNLVEVVRRVPVAELEHAYETSVFEYGEEKVPFFWAGALLQASAGSGETRTKTLPVAIFRSAGQRVALHVDEVLGNQEVVVKNLGPQLSRLPGLVGMSVLASGVVVLLYNPVALVAVYGDQAHQLQLSAAPGAGGTAAKAGSPQQALLPGANLAPMVLVVDDSITVRRVTQRLLKREGFRVVLASDGLQALERLQEEKPAVVLSDIEMPRMDGFDLVRNIRADANLRDLPVIMITSRIAEKHREHARELGVDHYLGKPYSEDELVGLVRQYCAALEVADV